MKNKQLQTVLISAVVSLLVSFMVSYMINIPTTQNRISQYYELVNAAEVSPHILIERVKGGEDIVIIDVRDPGAYAAAHISGAINIPAGDEDLVAKVRALGTNRAIVTYCYTEDCMASRQVGKILSENGIYVQHLNVGYAEWEAKEGTGDVFSKDSGACPLTGSAGC